mgnify:CR=1 FL=1
MATIFGTLLIRNEGNGYLTSVYLEHSETRPNVENCIRQGDSGSDDPFTGVFDTSWLEPGAQRAVLTISRQPGVVYDLKWGRISNAGYVYKGRAILTEGKLVGCYWQEAG